MFARNIVNLFWFGAPEHLIQIVELRRFGIVAEVTGMNQELRLIRQRIDLVHGRLEGRNHIRIGWLVEADVSVADLNEVELSPSVLFVLAECPGAQNTATHGPDDSRAGPSHAFQKPPAVDAVGIVVVNDSFRQAIYRLSRCMTLWSRVLFPR